MVMGKGWSKGLRRLDVAGANQWNWKGDQVGLVALHSWAKRWLSKPECCQHCGEKNPLDLANKSQEYKRDLSDWLWLCRRCHMFQDGRMEKLSYYKRKLSKNNKAGIRGVTQRKNGTWRARIIFRKKQIALGSFRTSKEAARAYEIAFYKIHGVRMPRNGQA